MSRVRNRTARLGARCNAAVMFQRSARSVAKQRRNWLKKNCVFGAIIENKRVRARKSRDTFPFSMVLIAGWLVKLIPFSNFGYLKPPGYENQKIVKN